MAVQLGTTVELRIGGDEVTLRSAEDPKLAKVGLDLVDPARVEPAWARFVAGVVAELQPSVGGDGSVSTTLPIGAGLSSSAALEVAVALALGFDGSPLELARLCRRAEQRATGVPCGIMDQLASAAGVEGHAMLIDCTTENVTPIPLPAGLEVVAVSSGQHRQLAGSAYAERQNACERARAIVGPLRDATLAELAAISEPEVRRRARHVVSENARTLAFADALRIGDAHAAGQLMYESHVSLRDDFEVSTPVLDALVDDLRARPGVYGARLTGAGFGGCAVVICEPGSVTDGWRLAAVGGANVQTAATPAP